MTAHALACQLFAPPGAAAAQTRHLLAQAAGSHARLLDSVGQTQNRPLDRLRETIDGYLRGPAPALEKRLVLDDPQFVEALHALAPVSDALSGWDATVAPGCRAVPADRQGSLGCARLGNVAAALWLRRARRGCGQIELATDGYGRIDFPLCDWTLVLVDQCAGVRDPLTHRTILLHVGEYEARWSLPEPAVDLVRMPRATFDAMFLDNRAEVPSAGVDFRPGWPRARFERAARLGNTRIRFASIARDAPAAHAEVTGAIVEALVVAIERSAPHIHGQLCQCIRTIQGFELPPYGSGQIASFSIPTSPGIIGFNVQYTAHDEPRLSPYAFMWLGHELGHTLHYLIDDVAYTHGWRFLDNPGETTPVIPRYGRSLTVRTLFQVPYVHLFEWWLLMQFHERGFADLPWQMFDDALAVGEDVRDEIDEAFELIDQFAQLTATGRAVAARLRQLVAEADSHWRRLSGVAQRRPTKAIEVARVMAAHRRVRGTPTPRQS